MAIDFPNSPTPGDIHTVSGRSWTYDGDKWALLSTTPAPSDGYTKAFLTMGA